MSAHLYRGAIVGPRLQLEACPNWTTKCPHPQTTPGGDLVTLSQHVFAAYPATPPPLSLTPLVLDARSPAVHQQACLADTLAQVVPVAPPVPTPWP